MNARAILAAIVLLGSPPAIAADFRWAAQGDANTLDPHATNEAFTNGISAMSYDPLVARGKDMSLAPALAESWENPSPTRWIFRLRGGVKFHDGSDLTADDVVFSFERARQSGATFRAYAAMAGTPRSLDERTVEFTTPAPNPTMVDAVSTIFIMSRAWCERHGVAKPQDYRRREATYAAIHAMGTGPFILESREPDTRTVHRRNPQWWGIGLGLHEGNVDRVEYMPIANAASRVAALLSGRLDFVLDPPAKDVATIRADARFRIWEGGENRVVFVGLDQFRDELLHASVKGRNPFKDRRVREALAYALDVDALRDRVMAGASIPTAIALPDPAGAGVPAGADVPTGHDPAAARRLLAEAGYPTGFAFTLHCSNDRLLNEERLCLALAAMWARIGLEVKVEVFPKARLRPLLLRREASAFLSTFGAASSDAIFALKPMLRSPNPAGGGEANFGNVRNETLDSLIDRIEVEMDPSRRRSMVLQAVSLMRQELPVIPLHRQVIPWASRSGVSVVHRPNNILNPIWVNVASP